MGVKIRLQIYTVPGQVFYNETRKLVLKNADAVVMVLDSQRAMREKNIESMNNLFENLRELEIPDSIPVVLQYNKRDLREIMAVDEMDRIYNTKNWPRVEAAAVAGTGVLQTLKVVTKQLYDYVRRNYFKDEQAGGVSLRDPNRPASRTQTLPVAAVSESLADEPLTALPAAQATGAAEPPASSTPAAAGSVHIGAIDSLLKEHLREFRDNLDLPFFDTARGLFNDLNNVTTKMFDEATKTRDDIAALKRSLDEFTDAIRSADERTRKSFLGGIWQKK